MKHMMVAALGAPLLFVQTAPAQAQVSTDDYFSQEGGPGGCYDPGRVTARQAERLERMGSKPCNARTAPTTSTSVSGSWYGDREGAAIDDAGGLGFTFGLLCERGRLTLSIVGSGQAERLLTRADAVTVAITGRNGAVTLTLPRQRDGEHWMIATPAQLAAIRSSTMIAASAPNWTARFSGAGATRALAAVRC